MKPITYLLTVSALLLLQTIVGCKATDDPNNFNPNDVPFEGSDRSHLEDTATEFLDYFKPANQRQLITSLDYLAYALEHSDFPDFNISKAAAAARSLSQTVADDDYMAYSRAATDLAITLSQFNGFFQHIAASSVWQKLEDSDDVRLRYWDKNQEYNLSLSGSIDTWSVTTSASDGTTYVVEVPKVLDLTLVAGSISVTEPNAILTIKLTSNFKDAEQINLTSEIKAANIYINTESKGNNTSVNQKVTFCVDDVVTYRRYTLFTSDSKLTGNGMCSIAAWKKTDESADAAASIIRNVSNTLMILRKVQIKSDVNDIKPLLHAADYFDKSNSTDPEAAAVQTAKDLKAAVNSLMYFPGEDTKVRAVLGWEACCYDEYYNEWGVRPIITFTSDNTPYSFEEYFGNNRFLSIETQLNKLIGEYSSFFRNFDRP